MEQILYTKTYQEYKAELDTELSKTAEGFVRIGYLLKVARDTDVLAESPYQTVTEFAKAEYGIDKTMVSRFISINDRFSEGGYSDQLQDQFRGYGYAKLTLMLSLPDEINQELSPAYSKAEIQAIKDEVDEEKAISDLEVMMEPRPVPAPVKGLLNMLIYQLGEDIPDLYVQMVGIKEPDIQEWIRKAKEILAPDAEKQYSIRISGTGRFLMSIRENEDTITVTGLRTLEKHYYTYQELRGAWEEILPPAGPPDTDWSERDCQNAWENTYNREYPGKVKVAPVQQKKPIKPESKPTPRKESKVQKARKPDQVKTEPPAKEKKSAPEPEKPKGTDTEAAGQAIQQPETYEQLPQEEKLDTPESENPESIGVEEKAASIIEFAPAEKDIQADTSAEEQLPGQIGMEEAIKEAEERNRDVSHIEPDNPAMAAGGEIDEELDLQWRQIKNTISVYMESGVLDKRLYNIPPAALRTTRKDLIKMTNVIEKELRRRGERF